MFMAWCELHNTMLVKVIYLVHMYIINNCVCRSDCGRRERETREEFEETCKCIDKERGKGDREDGKVTL